jgi:dCMP deaminase
MTVWLYCTMEPCRVCATLIISVGVRRVISKKRYHAAQDTRDLFKQAGIEFVVMEDQLESYPDQ